MGRKLSDEMLKYKAVKTHILKDLSERIGMGFVLIVVDNEGTTLASSNMDAIDTKKVINNFGDRMFDNDVERGQTRI